VHRWWRTDGSSCKPRLDCAVSTDGWRTHSPSVSFSLSLSTSITRGQ
jgi:hypothetical protein